MSVKRKGIEFDVDKEKKGEKVGNYMDKIGNISDYEKESLKFLERDFNQCFQQIRHYDAQSFSILKLVFTGYTAVIGVAVGLYQFGLEKNMDISLPAKAILFISFVVGLLLFSFAIRNRVYFVQLTRYLNEQRGLFFQHRPFNFGNKSKMYTDYLQPPFFNWRSSHAWSSYIIAALNSTLLGILLFIALSRFRWQVVTISCLFSFIIQLTIGINYLKSREEKSASEAVFGKD